MDVPRGGGDPNQIENADPNQIKMQIRYSVMHKFDGENNRHFYLKFLFLRHKININIQIWKTSYLWCCKCKCLMQRNVWSSCFCYHILTKHLKIQHSMTQHLRTKYLKLLLTLSLYIIGLMSKIWHRVFLTSESKHSQLDWDEVGLLFDETPGLKSLATICWGGVVVWWNPRFKISCHNLLRWGCCLMKPQV